MSRSRDAGAVPGWAGREEAEWAAYLDLPVLELHPRIPSTNLRALELLRAGAPPWSAVVAGEQTRGRGRGGRSWHSPAGGGLWISFVIASSPGGGPGVLPLAAGVAAARAVEAVAGCDVSLKWPNDLLVGGGKVAGVLCEAVGPGSAAGVVVGLGVNLRPVGGLPPELEAREVAWLEEVAGRPVREPELARHLTRELRRWAARVPEGFAGPLRSEWSRRDGLSGREVVCSSGTEGTAVGVSEEGALLVETPGGRVVPVRGGGVRSWNGTGALSRRIVPWRR